jgi:hypothetical protein
MRASKPSQPPKKTNNTLRSISLRPISSLTKMRSVLPKRFLSKKHFRNAAEIQVKESK